MSRRHAVKLGLVATFVGFGCGDTRPPVLTPDFNDGPTIGTGEGPTCDQGNPACVKGPLPNLGSTNVTLTNSPPPISGGTLLALADGNHVVASDPDRDRVYIVNLATRGVVPIALTTHDEPGRLAEDAQGQVHVVLRSGGAVATIDVASATLVGRRNVCVSPRGITFDTARSRLLVACETGEVIAMPPGISGAPTVFSQLASGLRDILVLGNRDVKGTTTESIFVSRFRTAEVMELTTDGHLVNTTRPDATTAEPGNDADATLAWRMIPPNNLIAGTSLSTPIVVHEFATRQTVSTSPGGYGAGGQNGIVFGPTTAPSGPGSASVTGCPLFSIVTPAISQGKRALAIGSTDLVLPVDVVSTADGFAVIAAGNGHTSSLSQVFVLAQGSCGQGDEYNVQGQPIALARLNDGSIMVQSREPAMLTVITSGDGNDVSSLTSAPYSLATDSVEDTGHAIFHSNSGAGIACASCHGEAADDGHIWTFDTVGARRTPSLRGTINGTAPYHWDGTMTDVGMLADQVMTGRMNGPQLSDGQKSALQSWLFAIPSPALAPTTADSSLVAQGQALFNDPTVGCAGCHSGPRFTNNATVDVGTGGKFQVPPLVGVRTRAPYLHDGCAATLRDRFGMCATPQHGNITQLQPGDIDALVAFLESI